jgi:phosphohistidine phosphatase
MKKLLLVRHAEAREAKSGEKDIDRLLTSKGMQDASRLGVYIYKRKIDLSAIVSSPSERTMETARLIATQNKFPDHQITEEEDLYEASVRILLQMVNNFRDEWDNVIVIGHNPVIMYFTEYISQEDVGEFEPCGMAEMHFAINSWKEVSQGIHTFFKYSAPEEDM